MNNRMLRCGYFYLLLFFTLPAVGGGNNNVGSLSLPLLLFAKPFTELLQLQVVPLIFNTPGLSYVRQKNGPQILGGIYQELEPELEPQIKIREPDPEYSLEEVKVKPMFKKIIIINDELKREEVETSSYIGAATESDGLSILGGLNQVDSPTSAGLLADHQSVKPRTIPESNSNQPSGDGGHSPEPPSSTDSSPSGTGKTESIPITARKKTLKVKPFRGNFYTNNSSRVSFITLDDLMGKHADDKAVILLINDKPSLVKGSDDVNEGEIELHPNHDSRAETSPENGDSLHTVELSMFEGALSVANKADLRIELIHDNKDKSPVSFIRREIIESLQKCLEKTPVPSVNYCYAYDSERTGSKEVYGQILHPLRVTVTGQKTADLQFIGKKTRLQLKEEPSIKFLCSSEESESETESGIEAFVKSSPNLPGSNMMLLPIEIFFRLGLHKDPTPMIGLTGKGPTGNNCVFKVAVTEEDTRPSINFKSAWKLGVPKDSVAAEYLIKRFDTSQQQKLIQPAAFASLKIESLEPKQKRKVTELKEDDTQKRIAEKMADTPIQSGMDYQVSLFDNELSSSKNGLIAITIESVHGSETSSDPVSDPAPPSPIFTITEDTVLQLSSDDFSLVNTLGTVISEAQEASSGMSMMQTFHQYVGGVDDALHKIIEMVIIPALLKQETSRGIILHGPPGTGKTSIAKAIGPAMGIADDRIVTVAGAEVMSKWVGESQENVRKLFAPAKRNPEKLYLYVFDEFESLAKKRSATVLSDSIKSDIVNELNAVMDGIHTLPNIIIVGSTNYIDQIDEALKRSGRFGLLLEIKPPEQKQRQHILEVLAKQISSDCCKFDKSISWQMLAEKTSGYTGADLRELLRRATRLSIAKILGSVDTLSADDVKSMAGKADCQVSQDEILKAIIDKEGEDKWDIELANLPMEHEFISFGENQPIPKINRFLRQVLEGRVRHMPILLSGPQGAGTSAYARWIAKNSSFDMIKVLSTRSLIQDSNKIQQVRNLFESTKNYQSSLIIVDSLRELQKIGSIFELVRHYINTPLDNSSSCQRSMAILATESINPGEESVSESEGLRFKSKFKLTHLEQGQARALLQKNDIDDDQVQTIVDFLDANPCTIKHFLDAFFMFSEQDSDGNMKVDIDGLISHLLEIQKSSPFGIYN
ncbi:AAA family ATPase [Endozoicomonas numazuensis]|uniref:AAA+ ATPase domain-containing protein n=1 Tax=Endozoicomonas numazuensis TaxID=1137799 RepID=A0A081MZC2_9GAMM|nr:ATP-binding protein [Endozoicomonas numazuensis]KEQ11545.1 hypothetical protein GZ78_28840 [Endozoicomonas numazuensis]